MTIRSNTHANGPDPRANTAVEERLSVSLMTHIVVCSRLYNSYIPVFYFRHQGKRAITTIQEKSSLSVSELLAMTMQIAIFAKHRRDAVPIRGNNPETLPFDDSLYSFALLTGEQGCDYSMNENLDN